MANVLNEVLTILNPLTWRKDSVENILTAGLVLYGREMLLLHSEAFGEWVNIDAA